MPNGNTKQRDDIDETRRNLLRKGSAAAMAGGIISVSGCMGDDDSGDVVEIDVQLSSPDFVPAYYEYGLLTFEAWEELGIEVNQETWAWDRVVSDSIAGHDHTAIGFGWGPRPDRIDPDFWIRNVFHSSGAVDGDQNLTRYTNPDIDEIAEAQRVEWDEEARIELIHEAQEILVEDQPVSIVGYELSQHARSTTRYENIPSDMPGYGPRSFWASINAEPKEGVDTLITSYSTDIANLNPLDEPDTPTELVQRFLFDRLMRIGEDGLPREWAASNVEITDETTVDVTLRDDLTFHDGEDLTVEDVKFSYELMAEHSPIFGPATDAIDDIEIIGDNEIRFNLESPDATFLTQTLCRIYIVPQHIYEDIAEDMDPMDYIPENPIGSGPLMFDYWDRDEEIGFEAFDDHFHPPEYDTWIRVIGADTPALSRLLEEDEIDIISSTVDIDIARQLEELDHVELVGAENFAWQAIHYQTEKEPFDDRAFRRALGQAIPKEDIIEAVWDGEAVRATSVISPFLGQWHNPDVPDFGDDMEAAREELENAGYRWDDEGRLLYPES